MSGVPTVYARLMDRATDEPRQELQRQLDTTLHDAAAGLADLLVWHLRSAYGAGIVDGYAQAVADVEDGDSYRRVLTEVERDLCHDSEWTHERLVAAVEDAYARVTAALGEDDGR